MQHPPAGKSSTDAGRLKTASRDSSSAPAALAALLISADASAPASFLEISAAYPAPRLVSPGYVPELPAPPAPAPKLPAVQKIAGESGSGPLPGKSSSNTPPFFCDTFPRTPAPPRGTRDQSFAPPVPPAPGWFPTASGPT